MSHLIVLKPALLALVLLLTFVAQAQELQTRWAAGVTPENAHQEYPRPQMVRENWVNLNGTWELKIQKVGSAVANRMKHLILVPFPVESQLSGVRLPVAPDDELIYSRTFQRPHGERVLLHFGACDWSTTVLVNGKEVGYHYGGYDPFTFDITEAINADGDQQLTVRVTDPTDSSTQPRGKQALKPEGIFYTSTSGIWQTVWLEGVPKRHIENFRIKTGNEGRVDIGAQVASGVVGLKIRAEAIIGGKPKAKSEAPIGARIVLHIPSAKTWTTEHPKLYNIRLSLIDSRGKVIDSVMTYCGFRQIAVSKGKDGQPQVLLNGKPCFMMGPLDQGFWPDGLYTAPSEDAMKYDLEVTKRLGFNMIRKHVKVEPDRWYYLCDKMGILVMQDMPSGDGSIGPGDPDIARSAESAAAFRRELKAMVDGLYNHPSIVSWVLYNEGWGQWDTAQMTEWLKGYDDSRLVDSTTGWADRGVGDFSDVHVYPGPGAPAKDPLRALILGEFGGLGLPVPGHMWLEKGWGYQSFKTPKELTDRFVELMFDLRELITNQGLRGAVYTQTTDVETELNGLMTYDRALVKMDEKRVREAIASLKVPLVVASVVPTSETEPATWRYTVDKPGDGFELAGFKDSSWKEGPGGFGTTGTPGAVVRTVWDTSDIWIRRHFTLSESHEDLALRLHHDDDVEVYLDGKPIYKASGWTSSYRNFPLGAVGAGVHTLAIHCHQNQGGQYIDAGLAEIKGAHS